MADFSITAANVVTTASRTTGTAGAAITQGQPLYIDLADANKLKPASATSATAHLVVGIALNAASANQPVSYVSQDDDFTPGFTSTIGTIIVLGTSGALKPSADLTTNDRAVLIGVMKSTSKAVINIGPFSRTSVAIPA